ncbi:MAG TPA: LamG domain-containing protein, partial [Actinomycetes bacterium]|nr:LamG domain-containing protein [Actinomycetes bacterium]
PSGALVDSFRPSVNGQVKAIAASNTMVWFGGNISGVGSASRNRLAQVRADNGALTGWWPHPGYGSTAGNTNGNRTMTNEVLSMVLTNNETQLVVAGRFDGMNGQPATGVAALDAVTGLLRPFAISRQITNQGINSAIWSLSTDGATVYGTGYNFYGPGNLEGSFAATADGGHLKWINDCRGDSYSTYAMGGALYHATHEHDCHNIGSYPEQNPQVWKRATAVSLAPVGQVGHFVINNTAWLKKPAPAVLPWFPTMAAGTATGQYQAGWSVSGNGQYVVFGGEFPTVNGVPQQGLVRYALPALAPNRVGPDLTGTAPTATVAGPGAARLAWKAAFDLDNANLTYRVYRDGNTTTPVATLTRASEWWNRPMMGWVDTGLSAGPHTYKLRVSDPAGNTVWTGSIPVHLPTGGSGMRPYHAAVRADGAVDYWPLGEQGGDIAWARAGGTDMQAFAGARFGAPGAIAGDPDPAVQLDGSTNGYLVTNNPVAAPQVFSAEFWFSTTSRAGGRFIGFGNARTGLSTEFDRLIYLDPAGRLNFGVWPLEGRAVTSPAAYNDGRWHHVVGTLSGRGLELHVDGALVASQPWTTR